MIKVYGWSFITEALNPTPNQTSDGPVSVIKIVPLLAKVSSRTSTPVSVNFSLPHNDNGLDAAALLLAPPPPPHGATEAVFVFHTAFQCAFPCTTGLP